MEKLPSDCEVRFERDGFFIAKNLLSAEVVETVKRGAGKLVDELVEKLVLEGKLNKRFENEPLEKRLLKIEKATQADVVPLFYRAELHRHPEFYALLADPDLLSAVRILLPEADRIRVYPNYSMRPKLPDYSPHEVVCHQDAGLRADGRPNTAPVQDRMDAFGPGKTVNCWTPLVPVTKANGAMKFVPGSHKLGIQKHVLLRQYREREEEYSYGRYATQIDPEVLERQEVDRKCVDIECAPGDVVFPHILFHRGGHNNSDHVRWSLDWRYQDAKCATLRSENGHILWSKRHADPTVIRDAESWTKLALT